MKTLFLFTYGLLTNRSHIGYQAKLIGPGVLNNYKFELLTHANVIKCNNTFTYGLVWEINDDILSMTDRIEGYPFYYDRVVESIKLNDESSMDCYVYTMTDESRHSMLNSKPSIDYVNLILDGYQELIPFEQLRNAMENADTRIIS